MRSCFGQTLQPPNELLPLFAALGHRFRSFSAERPLNWTLGARTPSLRLSQSNRRNVSGELFTVDLADARTSLHATKFERLYFARTGTYAGLAANEIYVAVHMIAAALRSTGPNRVLLRDYFANEGKSHRTEGNALFDPAGNEPAGIHHRYPSRARLG